MAEKHKKEKSETKKMVTVLIMGKAAGSPAAFYVPSSWDITPAPGRRRGFDSIMTTWSRSTRRRRRRRL